MAPGLRHASLTAGVLKSDESDFGMLTIGNRNLISFVGLLGYRSRMDDDDSLLVRDQVTNEFPAAAEA